MQVVLKLIDYFGPDNWPLTELEKHLGPVCSTANNKVLKASIEQAPMPRVTLFR
jgi:hypothetical protein